MRVYVRRSQANSQGGSWTASGYGSARSEKYGLRIINQIYPNQITVGKLHYVFEFAYSMRCPYAPYRTSFSFFDILPYKHRQRKRNNAKPMGHPMIFILFFMTALFFTFFFGQIEILDKLLRQIFNISISRHMKSPYAKHARFP